MFTRHHGMLMTLLLPAWAGCAAAMPPEELVNARTAYEQAKSGPAGQQDPADLEVARQALNKAEQVFADAPESQEARDFAYIAEAKARTADERGRTAAMERIREVAEAQVKATA